ncbi:MAG: hypothetical protein AAF539_11330 [Planctomycetota bacterium]
MRTSTTLISVILTIFTASETPAIGQETSRRLDQTSTDSITAHTSPSLLREGTIIGPIAGQIVRSGNAWRFVPDRNHKSPQMGMRMKPSRMNDSNVVRSGVANRESTTNRMQQHSINHPTQSSLQMILLLENLMLQRVARAIEEDPSDKRWVVTGKVTEFRDENRLLLQTIHRAPEPVATRVSMPNR